MSQADFVPFADILLQSPSSRQQYPASYYRSAVRKATNSRRAVGRVTGFDPRHTVLWIACVQLGGFTGDSFSDDLPVASVRSFLDLRAHLLQACGKRFNFLCCCAAGSPPSFSATVDFSCVMVACCSCTLRCSLRNSLSNIAFTAS